MSRPSRLRDSATRLGTFAIIFCALITLPVLRAQAGDTDMGEMAAFGGGTFGLNGAQGAFGASSGVSFSKYGLALIEMAFSSLGNETLRRRIGPRPDHSRLYDFNGSFHIRVPVKKRWAPYGIIGAGLLWNQFKVIPTGGSSDNSNVEPTPPGAALAVDEFNFAFHTGGGVRYHIREDWGIRPEFKVIVSHRTYTRFTVGIFYNLPAGWPL